mgnify:CR=1 FL=1
MGYRVVVVGATGNVGREMLNVLAEREFPADEIAAVASPRSTGIEIEYGDTGRMIKCQNIEHFDWAGWDMALFAIGSDATAIYAPKAAAAGCVVIDNSSLYRMDPDVPLIVPEVNPDALAGHKGIVANPNCVTAIMTVALAPLHRAHPIKRIHAATYQSASGAGAAAMQELEDATTAYLAGEPFTPKVLPHPYAFNLFSHNSKMDPVTGYNEEEIKMVNETRKILIF